MGRVPYEPSMQAAMGIKRSTEQLQFLLAGGFWLLSLLTFHAGLLPRL